MLDAWIWAPVNEHDSDRLSSDLVTNQTLLFPPSEAVCSLLSGALTSGKESANSANSTTAEKCVIFVLLLLPNPNIRVHNPYSQESTQ